MNKLTTKTWLAIAAVVIIILVYFYNSSRPQTASPAVPSATNQPANTYSNQGTVSQPARTAGRQALYVVSPLKGDKWALGVTHTIRWSSAAMSAGQIYLVSASTGNTIGWINPGTGTDQTSFDWTTKDVSISRTNPSRKDVAPGDYIIKIKFDNKTIPEITSGVFSVVYPSEIKVAVYNVSVKNFTATPSTLAVKRGDQVVIANNDSAVLSISVVGRSGMTIQPGQQEIFETANLSAGPYYLYSEQYPSLKLTVNVQ